MTDTSLIQPPAPARQRLRLLVGCLFGLVIVGGIASHRLGFADALSWADGLTRAVRETGPAGWVVFTLAQMVVAMAGIVPASLLGIAAGAVYGLFQGFLIASVGTLLGGWFAFKLARSLLRDWVEQRMARSGGRRFADLDAAVARDGWRFVCLLRISPIMPFAMTSYALGLSRIAGRDYLLGTLASLPALAGYVGVGALTEQGLQTSNSGTSLEIVVRWVLLGLSAAATVALILRSGWLLAKCGLMPGMTIAADREPPA